MAGYSAKNLQNNRHRAALPLDFLLFFLLIEPTETLLSLPALFKRRGKDKGRKAAEVLVLSTSMGSLFYHIGEREPFV